MTRINNEQVIQHFSHHHPLNLMQLSPPAACAGCKLATNGCWAYSCVTCSYALHVQCAQLQTIIRHPVDPHPLKLLPFPAYAEGHFDCDACGCSGAGFSYHCAVCSVDLHTLCASLPKQAHHCAHPHKLALAFAPPYGGNLGFTCDVCGRAGGNHWLYRCGMCGFDAHIACASSSQHVVSVPHLSPIYPPPSLVTVKAREFVPPQRRLAPGAAPVPIQGPLNRAGSSGHANSRTEQVFQGFLDGAAQQVGQNFMQGLLGSDGTGGGGDGSGSSLFVEIGSSIIGGLLS